KIGAREQLLIIAQRRLIERAIGPGRIEAGDDEIESGRQNENQQNRDQKSDQRGEFPAFPKASSMACACEAPGFGVVQNGHRALSVFFVSGFRAARLQVALSSAKAADPANPKIEDRRASIGPGRVLAFSRSPVSRRCQLHREANVRTLIAGLWLVSNLVAGTAWTQPFAPNAEGVTMGHWHLN